MEKKKSKKKVSDFGGDIPEAKGYLFFDTKKCTGCSSCMLACSLVHEGRSNLSQSRIQILDDPLGCYPTDIEMAGCKQCLAPQCISVCQQERSILILST